MKGIPYDLRAYDWSAAWRLTPDASCARTARSLMRMALTAVDLPGDFVYAAVAVASELAGNAYAHVLGRHSVRPAAVAPGLPELWLHLVEHPEPRLVVSVFDADRNHAPTLVQPAALEESGRGLQIVAALSAEWGCRPTRSRVGPWHVPGKSVWAALALPAAWSRPRSAYRRPTPLAAAERLHAALAERGINRIYRHGDGRLQVISVRTGLTVWVGGSFSWRDNTGRYQHRSLNDVADVAEQIISAYELGLRLTTLLPAGCGRDGSLAGGDGGAAP